MMLVAGEALFDVFVGAPVEGGLQMQARSGGSPFNMAIGLARLGRPVAFLGGIGKGVLGEQLLVTLRAEGVRTDWVQRLDAPTTLGLVALNTRGVPEYVFYGEGAADRRLAPVSLAGCAELALLQLGSYAAVLGETAAVPARCVEQVPLTCVVAYDPNVRPQVLPDLQAWRARLDWMLPRTQLLKLSAEDLALLHPGLAPDDFAARCLAAGVALVLVTLGEKGAFGACAAGSLTLAAAPVQSLADTVGAGDACQVGLLAWLAEQGLLTRAQRAGLNLAQLEAAMRFAARAAAIACMRRGADLARRAELA